MFDVQSFVARVYAAVDSMNPTQLSAYMAQDCRFRFGNMPEVIGHDAFESMARQFYSFLEGLSHTVINAWLTEDGNVISKVLVSYRRKDGFVLTCPAAGIWHVKDGVIYEYEIYVDNSGLFN